MLTHYLEKDPLSRRGNTLYTRRPVSVERKKSQGSESKMMLSLPLPLGPWSGIHSLMKGFISLGREVVLGQEQKQ